VFKRLNNVLAICMWPVTSVLCCVQAVVTAAATYGDTDKVKGLISGTGGLLRIEALIASPYCAAHLINPAVLGPVLPPKLLLLLRPYLHFVLTGSVCDAENVTFEQFAEAFAKPSQVCHMRQAHPVTVHKVFLLCATPHAE
jgi:hypothetical protein